MLYRPNSEFARMVEQYVTDFRRQKGRDIELIDIDSREGASVAALHGATQYPCLLVLREDGQQLQIWQGSTLPLMNELLGYLNA